MPSISNGRRRAGRGARRTSTGARHSLTAGVSPRRSGASSATCASSTSPSPSVSPPPTIRAKPTWCCAAPSRLRTGSTIWTCSRPGGPGRTALRGACTPAFSSSTPRCATWPWPPWTACSQAARCGSADTAWAVRCPAWPCSTCMSAGRTRHCSTTTSPARAWRQQTLPRPTTAWGCRPSAWSMTAIWYRRFRRRSVASCCTSTSVRP